VYLWYIVKMFYTRCIACGKHSFESIFFFCRRVKGYTRFFEKYVTGKRKRFRPYKVNIVKISITKRTIYPCPSVRPDGQTDMARFLYPLLVE